jgi:hypothetical protein
VTKRLFEIAGIVCCLMAPAFGQGGPTGAISGIVLDSSGGAVPGAEVQIVDVPTGQMLRKTVTNSDGQFIEPLLPASTYNIVVDAHGFAQTKLSNIVVRVTETTRITITVQVGEVKQGVEVSAKVLEVDTTTAVTGQSLSTGTIESLPLSTRNFQQLLVLSTGVSSDLTAAGQLGRGDVRMNVNGQREGNNNYLIEGISASDYNLGELSFTPLPSPDAVAEFKVQTSLYDASQGRNGGGNINATLRSGSSTFHGSAFEYFRNAALNANDFFFNRNGLARPEFNQNIFGGSLGGPLGSGAKLGYFFLNYQGTRQHGGLSPGTYINTIIPTVPTDRSAASLAQLLPVGFQNPANLDPVAVKLLNFKSNQFGGAGGGFLYPSLPPINPSLPLNKQQSALSFSSPGNFDDDQFTANWDRTFHGGADSISERFFFSDFSMYLPFGAGSLGSQFGAAISPTDLDFPIYEPVHNRFFSIAEIHTFTPRLLNEFRFGYVHIANDIDNVPIVNLNDLGISRPNSNVDTNIYRFEFASFSLGPNTNFNTSQAQNNFTFLDTVSYTTGRHFMRFGGEADRILMNKNFPQLFNGFAGFVPTPASLSLPSLSDFQNFLIGAPAFSGSGSGVTNHHYRINAFALFYQDDFKVTRNLTLNLGLRWELDGAVSDQLNHIANLIPNLALEGENPWIFPKGVNQLGVPGLIGTASETTTRNGYASNWAPRIGFAYDLFGHGTTAIRGGYGIYYDREDNGAIDNLGFASPFLAGSFGPGPPGSLANLPSFSILPPAGVISPAFVPVLGKFQGFVNNVTGLPTNDTTQTPVFSGNSEFLIALEVPQHFVSPNVQQWNLTVQRQLPDKWVLEVGYVGTKGTHLRETRTTIQPFLVSPQDPVTLTAENGQTFTITQNTISNATARSRVLGLGPAGMQLFGNDANSSYNSLQASVSRSVGRMYFQAAYTFSKSIDDNSLDTTAFNTVLNDQTNLRANRAVSDFDRPHRFVASYSYQLPFFSHTTGVEAVFLQGWSVSGIVTVQSGRPFSVIDSAGGSTYTPIGPDQSTASIAPGFTTKMAYTPGSTQARLNQYINPAAFMPAPVVGPDGSTGYGDSPRNAFRGPYQQNWDFSLAKIFSITERQKLEFRTEFFNMWNHPNFNNPTFVDISGPNFGAITTTVGSPRIIQFGFRYSF